MLPGRYATSTLQYMPLFILFLINCDYVTIYHIQFHFELLNNCLSRRDILIVTVNDSGRSMHSRDQVHE